MSILIKGIKFGGECWSCPCFDGGYGDCNALEKKTNHTGEPLPDCPIIELPDHGDLIYRQAAIDAPDKFIQDCNPEHFVGHQKFVKFMGNAEIGSFGDWQFANGVNMGLTAAEVTIKDLPSAQPERKKGQWIVITRHEHYPSGKPYEKLQCPFCKKIDHNGDGNFCGYCGAEMQNGENDG